MLRKIKLYGELAKFVGHKEFEVKADTVGKAVSFLIHNFPEIETYMSPKYYQVKVGNFDIDKNEIHHPIGKQDIHFIPVIQGAGRGLGKILLGGALIALSFGVGGIFDVASRMGFERHDEDFGQTLDDVFDDFDEDCKKFRKLFAFFELQQAVALLNVFCQNCEKLDFP